MADIEKLVLNGTAYNISDNVSRNALTFCNLINIESYIETGSIDATTGNENDSIGNRLRSRYLPPDTIGVSTKTGSFLLLKYSEDGSSYIGCWNGSIFTNVAPFEFVQSIGIPNDRNKYRIVYKDANGNITTISDCANDLSISATKMMNYDLLELYSHDIVDNATITETNTDIGFKFHKGDIILVTLITNGNQVRISTLDEYPITVHTNITYHYKGTGNLTDQPFYIDSDDKIDLHIWQSKTNNLGYTITVKVVSAIRAIYDIADKLTPLMAYSTLPVAIINTIEKNTDVPFVFKKYDIVHVNAITNGNNINVVLSEKYPYEYGDDYISLYSGNNNTEFDYTVEDDGWNCFHLYNSQSDNNGVTVNVTVKRLKAISDSENEKLNNKKYICFGDSITSTEHVGIGSVIPNICHMVNNGNYAHGNAMCANWSKNGIDETIIKLDTVADAPTNDNVLSNQIYRALQDTTPNGNQITWSHPINGNYSIPTTVGVGTGKNESPDVIYIAIGTNDGKTYEGYDPSPTIVVDDTDTVFSQSYAQLNKLTIASALRWAIETLQSVYPSAQIFVASPLPTNNILSQTMPMAFSYESEKLKRDIIQKVCNFCSVNFIDSFYESGFSMMVAYTEGDGIHPNAKWRDNIAAYVCNKMNNEFYEKK